MARQSKTSWQDDAAAVVIIKCIISFLGLFVPMTPAKKIVCIVLIMSGIPANCVIHLSGLSERSVRTLRKELSSGDDVSRLLCIQAGSGRVGKAAGIERQIMDELEKGNYYTRQQIADMINEKFHIKMSVSAVGNMLKKRVQAPEVRIHPRKSRPRQADELL